MCGLWPAPWHVFVRITNEFYGSPTKLIIILVSHALHFVTQKHHQYQKRSKSFATRRALVTLEISIHPNQVEWEPANLIAHTCRDYFCWLFVLVFLCFGCFLCPALEHRSVFFYANFMGNHKTQKKWNCVARNLHKSLNLSRTNLLLCASQANLCRSVVRHTHAERKRPWPYFVDNPFKAQAIGANDFCFGF